MNRFGKPKRGSRIINGPITIKVAPNEPLDSIVSRLIKHAKETNRRTRAAFNGLILNADSDSTAQELTDLYYDMIIAREV